MYRQPGGESSDSSPHLRFITPTSTRLYRRKCECFPPPPSAASPRCLLPLAPMAHSGAWQPDSPPPPLPCEEEGLLSAVDALRSDDADATAHVSPPEPECAAAGEAQNVPARAEALRCLEPSHGAECEWCAPRIGGRGSVLCVRKWAERGLPRPRSCDAAEAAPRPCRCTAAPPPELADDYVLVAPDGAPKSGEKARRVVGRAPRFRATLPRPGARLPHRPSQADAHPTTRASLRRCARCCGARRSG
jgi:hypothetical protein